MSGEVTEGEPTDLGQENDPLPMMDVSLTSNSNAGENDQEHPSEGVIPEDLANEELADEEAIPVMETEGPVAEVEDVVTEAMEDGVVAEEMEDGVVTEAVQDVEAGEKKENPLESIGAWFQGLVKGPSPETKELEDTKEVSEEDFTDIEKPETKELEDTKEASEEDIIDIENPETKEVEEVKEASEKDITDIENPIFSEDVEKEESEPSPTDSVEPMESSKSILSLETESETKSGSLSQHITDLFGNSKTIAEEATDDAEKQAPTAKKGIQEHVGAFFRSRQRTSKDESGGGSERNQFGAFMNSGTEKMEPTDEYESFKKQGGMRQKVSSFLGTKQKRTLVFAGMIVLVSLFLMTPLIIKELSALGSYALAAGQVVTFLQAEMIPHPLYQGNLFPSGQIVLR
jgi:hypothetical protein